MGYCSTSPLHGVLFNHPSTGYCSSSPPPATVQPALHGVLFIQPSMGSYSSSPPRGPVHPALHRVLFIHRLDRSGSCSSSGNVLYYHGVLFIQPPTRNCSSKPPNNTHYSSREGGNIVRSASVSSRSKGITLVQLTTRDRSIARVQ